MDGKDVPALQGHISQASYMNTRGHVRLRQVVGRNAQLNCKILFQCVNIFTPKCGASACTGEIWQKCGRRIRMLAYFNIQCMPCPARHAPSSTAPFIVIAGLAPAIQRTFPLADERVEKCDGSPLTRMMTEETGRVRRQPETSLPGSSRSTGKAGCRAATGPFAARQRGRGITKPSP